MSKFESKKEPFVVIIITHPAMNDNPAALSSRYRQETTSCERKEKEKRKIKANKKSFFFFFLSLTLGCYSVI